MKILSCDCNAAVKIGGKEEVVDTLLGIDAD